MPIRFMCPGCSTALQVPEVLSGEQISCPTCRRVLVAPAARGGSSAPPAPTEIRSGRTQRDADSSPVRRLAGDDEASLRPHASRSVRKPPSPAVLILAVVAGGLVVLCLGGGLVGIAALVLWESRPTTTAVQEPAKVPDNKGVPPAVPPPAARLPPIEEIRDDKFTKPPPAPALTSYLHAVSSQGDYIGQGKTYNYRGDQLKVRRTERGVEISVDGWTILFGAPHGQFLQVGEYPNARRYPFSDKAPGIEFFGQGRGCNRIAGKFVVWELEFRENAVARLAIDFVQRCEESGPPLYGRIRYNSSLQ